MQNLLKFIGGVFLLISTAGIAGEFNSAIEKVKLGTMPMDSIYEPFLYTEFFTLIMNPENSKEVTNAQFKFHIIELRNSPMVVIGESPEVLATYVDEKMSSIKMTGKELINAIHPQVGVSIVWQGGGFNFPPNLVQELRIKFNR